MSALDISGGAVFVRLVEQARALGLDVEIETDPGAVMQTVTAIIRRPRVEERNALDVVRNGEWLMIHAVRTFNEGRWSTSATKGGCASEPRRMTLRTAPYALEGMTR